MNRHGELPALGQIHISWSEIYRYRGYTFEFHRYCGPQRVHSRTLQPIRQMGKKFWQVFEEWIKLPKAKQKATRIV